MDYNILKNLLKERGLTFQDLADKLNTDRANLYTSLTKGNPTLQRLESVANVLGVPIIVFLLITVIIAQVYFLCCLLIS